MAAIGLDTIGKKKTISTSMSPHNLNTAASPPPASLFATTAALAAACLMGHAGHILDRGPRNLSQGWGPDKRLYQSSVRMSFRRCKSLQGASRRALPLLKTIIHLRCVVVVETPSLHVAPEPHHLTVAVDRPTRPVLVASPLLRTMADAPPSSAAPVKDTRTREEMIADFEKSIALAKEKYPEEVPPPGHNEKWYLPVVDFGLAMRV